MQPIDQAAPAGADATASTETGNDAGKWHPSHAATPTDLARWSRNADDLALIAGAGRGEVSTHEAMSALHRLLSQVIVAS